MKYPVFVEREHIKYASDEVLEKKSDAMPAATTESEHRFGRSDGSPQRLAHTTFLCYAVNEV